MAIDNDVLLRDGTVELNSSEATPTALDCGGEDLVRTFYQVDVYEATDGTDETLDVVIQGSNTSASAGFVDWLTFPQITAQTAAYQKILSGRCPYRWRRAKTTVGGSNSPSFHGVKVSIHPAGRDDEK
jgi:hypothetical protein